MHLAAQKKPHRLSIGTWGVRRRGRPSTKDHHDALLDDLPPRSKPRDHATPEPRALREDGAYIEEMKRTGVLLDTGGLAPSSRGARVRRHRGKVTVTDGPFTESKELIAGFAIMQLPSLAEAKQRAKGFLEYAGDGENEIRAMHECASRATSC